MTSPSTAAGRALLRDLWGAYAPGVESNEVTVRDRILAIEAEARQAAPLDAEWLIARLESIKRVKGMTMRDVKPEDMGHDMGVAHAQDQIRVLAYAAATTDEEGRPDAD